MAAPGLEPLVARELAALGFAGARVEPGGVAFEADGDEALARAHLWLRTASRVLVRVGAFEARAFSELERRGRRLPWAAFVARGEPARFRVTCKHSRLYHSGAVAERLQDAAARATGAVAAASESDEEEGDPTGQLFVVRVADDLVTVSADASGALLHRRGWRLAPGRAPLRETLAAALLVATDWDPAAPLVDPMCGSGTIAIEAALIARNLAPGRARRFRFLDWADIDGSTWARLCDEADAAARPSASAPAPIVAADADPEAIAAARANAARAGVAADVELRVADLSALTPPTAAGWLVTNPPYGERVGARADLPRLYRTLGDVVRRRLDGWTIALLVPPAAPVDATRLRFTPLVATRNGGIAVRLLAARYGIRTRSIERTPPP